MDLQKFFADKKPNAYRSDSRYKAWEILNNLLGNSSLEDVQNFFATDGYIVRLGDRVELIPAGTEIPKGARVITYKEGAFFKDKPGGFKRNHDLFFLSSDLLKYIKQPSNEVRRMQKLAGIKEDGYDTDYDMGTSSGDTDSMNIAEDEFGKISQGLEKNPLP